MKRVFLLIIFFSIFLVQNNVFAEPPDHAANDWEAIRVTKIGFSSSGLSASKLQDKSTIQDSDFDFVKTLDSPVWVYLDYNTPATLHTESVGTISGIPVGSYYAYMYLSEDWYYSGGWTQYAGNFWSVPSFCLNGSCTYNSTSGLFTSINQSNFVKVTIGNNETTNLTQTLTDINVSGNDYTYTYSVQSSTQ